MEEVGGDLGFAGGATRRRFLVLHRGEFRCRSLYIYSSISILSCRVSSLYLVMLH